MFLTDDLYVFKSHGRYYKSESGWVVAAERAKTFDEEESEKFSKLHPSYIKINLLELVDGSYDGP